jgi:hypothetical protein
MIDCKRILATLLGNRAKDAAPRSVISIESEAAISRYTLASERLTEEVERLKATFTPSEKSAYESLSEKLKHFSALPK